MYLHSKLIWRDVHLAAALSLGPEELVNGSRVPNHFAAPLARTSRWQRTCFSLLINEGYGASYKKPMVGLILVLTRVQWRKITSIRVSTSVSYSNLADKLRLCLDCKQTISPSPKMLSLIGEPCQLGTLLTLLRFQVSHPLCHSRGTRNRRVSLITCTEG